MIPQFLLAAVVLAPAGTSAPDPALAERFARLALQCVHREYPNKIAHVLNGDEDARPPRELTPAFFGCYDWHSAVHAHWLLARLLRLSPAAPFAPQARAALERSLTSGNLAAEVRYLQAPGRVSFERPYGLAWLLQLAAELREWDDADARRWAAALAPLEREAAGRIASWLPKLTNPIRVGEHSQTAFAFGLILDWSRRASGACPGPPCPSGACPGPPCPSGACPGQGCPSGACPGPPCPSGACPGPPCPSGERDMEALLQERIRAFYSADRACPLAYEPSGEDFLSPCLAEADLMRRVLAPPQFAAWLTRFLPGISARGGRAWLAPAVVTDPSDPKLAHLDGLNLSRAWMLEGIASGLPAGDGRFPALAAAAAAHREAGLRAVTGEHYEGGHWLGTFAVYLVTGRGLVHRGP